MAEILDSINLVLDFCLTTFTNVITWAMSNPILALGILIPLSLFIIAMVFRLVGSLFNRNKGD